MRIEIGGGTLFIVFLVLKLTNVINWSWWWVTSPLWISFSLFLIFIFITFMTLFILELFD